MNDKHTPVSVLEVFRDQLHSAIERQVDLDTTAFKELIPSAILAVISALQHPIATRSLNSVFLHLIEVDEHAFVSALRIVFRKETFTRIDNTLHFLALLSGPGFNAILSTDSASWTMRLLGDWLKSQGTQAHRVLFADQLPQDEREILEKHGLLSITNYPCVIEIAAIDRDDFLHALKKVPAESFPTTAWMASEVIPDDGLSKAIALTSRLFAKADHHEDANQKTRGAEIGDRRSALSLMTTFYDFFRRRFAEHHRPSDMEKLHHIVWFVLTYLSADADTGLFRPYAEIDASSTKLLVDYLLLNPKEHLLFFVVHNRSIQYASLSKYGMEYDGAESSGGTVSGVGLNRTLSEVPFAEYLLQPALSELLSDYERRGALANFWNLLKRDWLRPGEPTSSLLPVVLRRACVPSLVKLAVATSGKTLREVFAAIEFLVSLRDGIPDTAMKVFSELRGEPSLFKGRKRKYCRKLIERDMEASGRGILTNGFAFECLLKLVSAGDRASMSMAVSLLKNAEFQTRDHFEYNIVANIEVICGTKSTLLKNAVRVYLESPNWQGKASESTRESVQRYRAAHEKSKLGALAQDLASDRPELQKSVYTKLAKLAETDFLKFVKIVKTLRGTLSLPEAFPQRGFFVDVIDKMLAEVAISDLKDGNDPRVTAAIGLLEDLASDPDPAAGDKNDEKVRGGEKCSFITGIRARTCYPVAQLACLRPFLKDAWRLTRQLLYDKSAYVQHFAFSPFIEVLRRRTWDEMVRKESVLVLWDLFGQSELPEPIKVSVLRAFNYVRDLTEADAVRVLDAFKSYNGVESLYVFYGIFRKIHIEQMGAFDCRRFAGLLEGAIDSGTDDLPLRILRTLESVINEDAKDAPLVVPYILRYSRPNHATAEIVETGNRIVEELLTKPSPVAIAESRNLLLNFTKLETVVLTSAAPRSRQQWIYSIGEQALKKLFEDDRDGFYEYFDLLADNIMAGKMGWNEGHLMGLLQSETALERIEKLQRFLDKLVEKYPQYFPLRQQWMNRKAKGDVTW